MAQSNLSSVGDAEEVDIEYAEGAPGHCSLSLFFFFFRFGCCWLLLVAVGCCWFLLSLIWLLGTPGVLKKKTPGQSLVSSSSAFLSLVRSLRMCQVKD